MKVLEIKNNLVKISFTPADKLMLAGFVIIEDEQTPYVAQVLSLKADNDTNYAIVRLLFTFNTEGIVKNYDGTIPSLDAAITKLSSDELLDILPVNTPLEIGELAQQKELLKVDSSILEKSLLVCSENQENSNILTGNFVLQLENNNDKSVVFDIDGSYPAEKLVFGKDFKLPLNYDTINYIYEHDLQDVEPVSKAIIQDIFLEVQEYSKTVLDKFIPFDTFINVVDQQYRATGITELILLKNKLLRYKDQNVFAQDAKDIQSLRAAIRANMTNVLDISTVEGLLQNEIMSYVYDAIDEMDLFVYAFVQFTNDNADKKLIRHLVSKDKIYSTIVCSHNYKYLYELKERANNLILFAPQTLQHDFAAYNTFLNKLNPDEFVIYGKATQNIPLIVELAEIEPETSEEEPEAETVENLQEEASQPAEAESSEPEEEKPDDFSDESNSYSYETLLEDTAPAVSAEDTPEETEPQEADNSDSEQQTTEIPAAQEEESQTASNIIPSAGNILEDSEPVHSEVIIAAPEQISNIIDEEIQEEAATEPEISEPEPEIAEPQSEITEPEQTTAEPLPEIFDTAEDNIALQPEISDIETSEAENFEPQITEDTVQPEIIETPAETVSIEQLQPNSSEKADDEDEEEGFPEILDVPEPEVQTINGLEPLSEDFQEDLSIIDPLNISDEPVDMPVIEYSDNSLQILEEPEIIEEVNHVDKVAKDVDEILFSQEKQEFPPIDDVAEPETDLTEDDLNFIEDINNVEEEKPPVVPVYPTEDTPADVPVFEQGDKVKHPKYGEGVVEKMIKYGNKTLCSINFVNIGRRLLDPAISELSKA